MIKVFKINITQSKTFGSNEQDELDIEEQEYQIEQDELDIEEQEYL